MNFGQSVWRRHAGQVVEEQVPEVLQEVALAARAGHVQEALGPELSPERTTLGKQFVNSFGSSPGDRRLGGRERILLRSADQGIGNVKRVISGCAAERKRQRAIVALGNGNSCTVHLHQHGHARGQVRFRMIGVLRKGHEVRPGHEMGRVAPEVQGQRARA